MADKNNSKEEIVKQSSVGGPPIENYKDFLISVLITPHKKCGIVVEVQPRNNLLSPVPTTSVHAAKIS